MKLADEPELSLDLIARLWATEPGALSEDAIARRLIDALAKNDFQKTEYTLPTRDRELLQHADLIRISKAGLFRWCRDQGFPPPAFWMNEVENATQAFLELRAVAKQKTGLPGRPGSRHLIMPIIIGRRQASATATTLAEEARACCAELVRRHPDAHPISEKTMQNLIRDIYDREKLPAFWLSPQHHKNK